MLLGGCGNGFVEGGEACDDGNKINGDGCSAGCTIETGWTCTFSDPIYLGFSSCTETKDGIWRGDLACDMVSTT